MSRFRDAVEVWRKLTREQRRGFAREETHATYPILLDVVEAVDAYERTIADLKRQNKKARGRSPRASRGILPAAPEKKEA